MSRWADSTDDEEEDYVATTNNGVSVGAGNRDNDDELFDGPSKSFNDDEVRRCVREGGDREKKKKKSGCSSHY